MKQFFKFTFASCLGFSISFLLMGYLIFAIIGGVISSMNKNNTDFPANSVLHVNLSNPIVERAIDYPSSPLLDNYASRPIGLDDILTAIENAKYDPRINGILIDAGNVEAGTATLSQIRKKLRDFKESGKFIYAYSDNYGQKGYYLASIADSVFVNPVGAVDLRGISANTMFFKNIMDKLGVEMQIFKVGAYKSAVEPYIHTQMSDPNRQQVTAYTNSIWNNIVEEIAEDRKIPGTELQELVNEGIFAQDANGIVAARLADAVEYRESVNDILRRKTGAKNTDDLSLVGIADMAAVPVKKNQSKDVIAMIYAHGEIDGNSADRIDTKALAEEIYKIKADSSVKAVVLRVNSPGGSAFGSEQVWKALADLKDVKPYVVSMGDYAASGGYYISCNGNWIVAEPTTLTGSIGIFGMVPNAKALADKVGITFDEVKTSRFASGQSLARPMDEQEKLLTQQGVDRGYELFTRRCAEGRGMPVDSLKKIAQGHVWTGEMALERGLVDELGGIEDAFVKAAELAGVASYSVKTYPDKKDFWSMLLDSGSKASLVNQLGTRLFGENYKYYQLIQDMETWEPIQARMPYALEIK